MRLQSVCVCVKFFWAIVDSVLILENIVTMTSSGLALHPPESLCDDWAPFSGPASAPAETWQGWLLPLLQPFSKVHSLILFHPPGLPQQADLCPELYRFLFLHTSHSLKLFKVPRRGSKKLLKQKGSFSWSQGSRPVGTMREAPKLSYQEIMTSSQSPGNWITVQGWGSKNIPFLSFHLS